MITQIFVRTTRLHAVFAAPVAVSCLLAANPTQAGAPEVTVAIHVDAHGLDLTQETGARKLYQRIKFAAWVACTHANRVALAPEDDPMKCADQSLSRAIRSVSVPALTRIYLETHTLQQAAVAGITVPLATNDYISGG
jgi:UrcA family protein